jgi:hypothetical protein
MGQVVTVNGADFAGAAEHTDTTITATLRGTADYAAIDAVEMLLTRIHSAAHRLGVKQAIIDLTQLEFMNSSCFKSFVSWITDIQELDPGRRYTVTFVSNPKLHWQKRSLHSLRCFAVDLVSVSS